MEGKGWVSVEKEGFTSPASPLPDYELKMLQQYIHGVNLIKLGESLPDRKKQMMLIKFFKHKRNQQIEVIYVSAGVERKVIGKVNIVGRDFVSLTTLTERIWIPYTAIESANIPFGYPDVPNPHQHVVIDDELRKKLLTQFGKTVSGQEVLKQQFFEESLEKNLQQWIGSILEIHTKDAEFTGKLTGVEKNLVLCKTWKNEWTAPLADITYLRTVRPRQLWPYIYKQVKQFFQKQVH